MGEILSVSGTRNLKLAGRLKIRAILLSMERPDRIVTGGCIGVDAYVAALGKELGIPVHTIVPADRSRVDREWRRNCDTFEELPADTTYRDRNVVLVERGTSLLAFPELPEDNIHSRRSGTWQTVRIAKKIGRTVRVETLN